MMRSKVINSRDIIEQVKKRPALYDHRVSGNNDPIRRKVLWEEIALNLYEDTYSSSSASEKEALVKEIQVKWKSLRDSYNRIRKAQKDAALKGIKKPRKKYIFYDQLSFLEDIAGRKYSPQTIFLSEQNDSMDYSSSENSNPLKEEDVLSENYNASSTIVRNDEDDGATASSNDRMADLLKEMVAVQKENQIEDKMGNKKFLLSLLPFLEKLPDDVNLEVRLQLMSVIQTYSSGESFMKIS